MRPIVNMAAKDRATDIGNIHKKIGKDRACGSGGILAERQRDRHTHRQTYSSQYFATVPAGEVIRHNFNGMEILYRLKIFTNDSIN